MFYDYDGQRAVCEELGRPDLLRFAWGRVQSSFAALWVSLVAWESGVLVALWILP